MKTAVITCHYRTPREHVQKCVDSIRAQSLPLMHIVVCDGDSLPPGVQVSSDIQVIHTPKAHQDCGAAARSIGCVSAIVQGADAIAFLDSDNWWAPDHLHRCLNALHSNNVAFVSTARYLVDLDGDILGLDSECDGQRFVDTNCMVFGKQAFSILPEWYLMNRAFFPIGDRLIWQSITEKRISKMHITAPTVYYRTNYLVHYQFFGRTPPPNAKVLRPIA